MRKNKKLKDALSLIGLVDIGIKDIQYIKRNIERDNMSDKYNSFNDLSKNEQGNFKIEYNYINSYISIIAPHGGKIEKYTDEIAKEIASNKYNYYAFIGSKKEHNRELHITSHKFNEPKAIELVEKSDITISIHGCKDETERDNLIYLGGLNDNFKNIIMLELINNGFEVSFDKFKGKEPLNICNRSKENGVQIELTKQVREGEKLREKFIESIINVLEKNS